jgi:hypothetical protein
VITMMMATVLSRVGPHVSLARWLLASKWENIPSIRVADPDPDWIRIESGQWIRIQEGKNDPQK